MNYNVLLQGAVLSALLFIGLSAPEDGSGARASRRRNNKCRCKKYISQLNVDIDKKLKAIEHKFQSYFTQSISEISNNNKTERLIGDVDARKLNMLTEDVNYTKQSLQQESVSLQELQQNIQNQEMSVEVLNQNFKTLDSIVRNLSRVVEKLEHSMRVSMERQKVDTVTSHIRRHRKRKKEKVPTTPTPLTYAKDCDEVYKSGGMKFLGDYYIMIKPDRSPTPFKTVCKIIDGAGWTVVQRRQDGRENFSRNWQEYKEGFGHLQNEFWLGNEKIHIITAQGNYKLKIDMEDWEGHKYYAEYDRFWISGEDDNYRLHVSEYHGTAGDSLTSYWRSHDGMQFSTRDRDNDNRFYDNCAEHYNGGWWYNDCFESHLNGIYYQNGSHNNYFVRNGIQWNKIHSYSSLKFVEIMIKPSDNAKMPNDI